MTVGRFAILFVAVLLALAGAGATAENSSGAGTVRWAHPALWRIERGGTTVSLFGSVHIIPGNVAWSDAEIDSAIRRSDVFVFEASLGGGALADMRDVVRTRGRLPHGQTLRELLSPKGMTDYLAVLQELGIAPQSLDQFRPWLALFYISLKHTTTGGLTAPGSVDPAVMSYAQSHGKEMRFFETAREQLAIFGDMDEATEIATFEASLAQYHERPQRTASVIDAWARGDSDTLAAMLVDAFEDVPQARRALVDDRNRRWAAQIQTFLREPNRAFFVTVGAGHFGGRTGVIALLCAAGIPVVRVERGGAADKPACPVIRH